MIKKLLMFIFLTSISLAQTYSTYTLSWDSDSSSSQYIVFVEFNIYPDSTQYVLQDSMDFKEQELNIYLIDTVTTTTYNMYLDNDGTYIVYGVVGLSDEGLYGPMSVQSPFKREVSDIQYFITPPVLSQ